MLKKDNNNINNLSIKDQSKLKKLKFKKNKNIIFIISIILSLLLIVIIYFYNDDNKIRYINIKGNIYLSEKYILDIIEISLEDKYLFILPPIVETRLNNSSFIKDSKVSLDKYNTITIEIIEKKMVAYIFNDNLEVLTEDGEIIIIPQGEERIISYIPLIFGDYLKENLILIGQSLATLNNYIIQNIAEIHPYSTTYDSNMLRIIMRDGRSVFSSYQALSPINHYFDVASKLNSDDKCLYTVEDINSMYSSLCPWEIIEEEEDKKEDQKDNETNKQENT